MCVPTNTLAFVIIGRVLEINFYHDNVYLFVLLNATLKKKTFKKMLDLEIRRE